MVANTWKRSKAEAARSEPLAAVDGAVEPQSGRSQAGPDREDWEAANRPRVITESHIVTFAGFTSDGSPGVIERRVEVTGDVREVKEIVAERSATKERVDFRIGPLHRDILRSWSRKR